MPSIDIKIEWNTALNENSVKYEILKALEKQYPQIKFTCYNNKKLDDPDEELIDDLHKLAMEPEIPDWVMCGGSD